MDRYMGKASIIGLTLGGWLRLAVASMVGRRLEELL
jgi:hypothetical protein